MADQDLYDILQAADPATLKMMIDSGLVPGRSAIEKEALGMGQGLMDTPQPGGRQVGNTYVASSPLEHLAAAVRQGIGAKMTGDAMRKQGALQDQLGAGRLEYLKMLAGNPRQSSGLGAAPQMLGDDLQPTSGAGAAPQMQPDATRAPGVAGPFRPGQGYPGMPDARAPQLTPEMIAQILGG